MSPSSPIATTKTSQRPSQAPQAKESPGLAQTTATVPVLSTPDLLKLPPYNSEVPSDKMLSKRKLDELLNTLGADEYGETYKIDGDIEELLLDMVDEFVTDVTSFACRLQKHRKIDDKNAVLDVKDVQLHLERNWNIRIPGYSSDGIKSVKKKS